MVLFKRKPVQFLPPAHIKDDNTEVWYIEQTGEIFTSYEEYLNRIDFYKQKRFICQITGHSGMDFFDALKSELAGAEEVEQAFPEALKGPVLRRVQFQTVSRIDTLVDMIFDEFKTDYYPGEAVTVTVLSGERLYGTVREKTRFGAKVLPDGTLSQPFSRYFVSLDGRPEEEAVVDDAHISRDRKIFTKLVLRSFIKKTVTREAWNGAPWLVKHDVAAQYHIDTRVPPHLRYDNKLLERKQQAAQKRASQTPAPDVNGSAVLTPGPMRLPELKPAPKNQKGKLQPPQVSVPVPKSRNPFSSSEPAYGLQAPSGNPYQYPISFRNPVPPQPIFQRDPTPPPPPRYPIEDLQLPPRDDLLRPPLKFLCKDPAATVTEKVPYADQIKMKAVGPLLETWDTLNVYCEIFKLDSFTFDDFVETMCAYSEETPIQLFDEIHCSVLKILVDSAADGGRVQIALPEMDYEEEEEEEEEEVEEASPEPEPQPKPAGRATRSSLAKQEAERLAAEAAAAEKEKVIEPLIKHRADELLSDYDWIEQLRKRDFPNGGWQMIMVGLLYQLSKHERFATICEDLLAELVPRDVDPTRETTQQHYARLDPNHRVQALQIICMLTMETKAVRAYMDDCNEQMTTYRKDKIDWQRQKKQAMEELRQLNEQRKVLLPENMPPSPEPEPDKVDDAKATEPDDSIADSNDSSDEDAHARRTLRRGGDRAAERQKKREEEQKRKEEAEAAAKIPKQSKQFIKLLKDIQKKEEQIKKCEDEVAVIENDLREADCPRTRVLGKDRFWNRYYWFERNGMPYGGLPNSSTASADYANGCIWVQGPDELERLGYIDMAPEYQKEYKAKFDMTVPQRKRQEEGSTSVFNAWEWGFYSEPEELDQLLRWLDPRGFNELKLRKEILAFKDKIVANMENRKRYLRHGEEEGGDDEDGKKEGTKRMSTRTRHQQQQQQLTPDPQPPRLRCLAWQNTMALEELGHLHSEPPPPPRPRKQGRKREAVEEIAPPVAKRTRR